MSGDTGLLLGALKEFKHATELRLDRMEKKVDALNEFKWRLAGGLTLFAFILTGIIELIIRFKEANPHG